MIERIGMAAVCVLLAASSAHAATLTYTGTPLSVASEGGNGATQVLVSFAALSAPLPGKCVTTQKVAHYNDGAHTLKSLKAQNYILTKNTIQDTGSTERKVMLTYATVCLGKDGATVSGRFQVYFAYNAGLVYGWFLANNLGYTAAGDDVELDLYFGGEVPQVYSNTSATQGAWTIAP